MFCLTAATSGGNSASWKHILQACFTVEQRNDFTVCSCMSCILAVTNDLLIVYVWLSYTAFTPREYLISATQMCSTCFPLHFIKRWLSRKKHCSLGLNSLKASPRRSSIPQKEFKVRIDLSAVLVSISIYDLDIKTIVSTEHFYSLCTRDENPSQSFLYFRVTESLPDICAVMCHMSLNILNCVFFSFPAGG